MQINLFKGTGNTFLKLQEVTSTTTLSMRPKYTSGSRSHRTYLIC